MTISEFALIERFFTRGDPAGEAARGVTLGIGDDCALLQVPAGMELAVSIDTLVEGVHFPSDIPAASVASRALGACLSDLAAMGAQPAWMTLALTLPNADQVWLDAFSTELLDGARHYGLSLVGGDTTRGPLSVSLQVHGLVPKGEALRRDGARAGDLVFVTGTLGDAMAGLDQLQQAASPDARLVERFLKPAPQIDTGLLIRPLASAAIDLSDGLLADLGHILERSGCGALVDPAKLPLSEALSEQYESGRALQWAQSGGEDFELCFTVAPDRQDELEAALADHPVPCTRVGVIEAQPGLRVRQPDGSVITTAAAGYQHF